MRANIREQIISRICGALLVSASLLLAAVAQATPTVLHDPEGNVTHIYGLEWNSKVYDVEFVFGKGSDVFGGIVFDFNDPDSALTAADVVADVLNAESTSVTTVGSPGLEQSLYNIPWQINGSNVRVVRGEIQSGEWAAFVPSTGSRPTDDALDYTGLAGDYSWANFTETDDPPSGNQPPVAHTGGPYTGEVDVAVDFDGSASNDPDGEIIAWLWRFGDSASASGETVSHTYDTDKVFNVTLEVTDSQGVVSSDSTSAEIVLGEQPPQPPEADAGGPYYGEAGVAVNFDGNRSIDRDCSCADESGIKFFEWDFDDGNFASGSKSEAEYVSHTYDEPGVYDVTLRVTDEDGMVDSDNAWANISGTGQPETEVILDANNLTTVIRIENLPIRLTSGQTVVYNIDFIYDTGRNVFELESDFPFTGSKISREANANLALIAIGNALNGNATVPDSAGVPSEDIFYIGIEALGAATSAVGGEFKVAEWEQCGAPNCLQGSATLGLDDLVTYADLVVSDPEDPANNPPPVANAGGPYTGTAGAAVDFDGSASSDEGGSITAWIWEFGDDEIDVGPRLDTISHVYDTDAVYPVTLWVIDNTGQIDSTDTTATVGVGNQPPVAVPGGPYSADVDADVTFDGSASNDPDGEIAYWIWHFGDDTLGAGEVVSHRYSESGTKNVTLAVVDSAGAASAVSTVAVIDQPGPDDRKIDLVTLGDVGGGPDADLAVLDVALVNGDSISATIHVRDGGTGDEIYQVELTNSWRSLALESVIGNTGPLLAILQRNGAGDLRVHILRASDGTVAGNIQYFDNSWTPIDLLAVSDAGGPGITGIGVLAENPAGQQAIEVHKLGNGAFVERVLYFNDVWKASDALDLGDFNGNGRSEMAVLATNNAGKHAVETRDALSGKQISRHFFLGPTNTMIGLAGSADVDGNGKPELIVLGNKDAANNSANTAQTKDVKTGALISKPGSFPPPFVGFALRSMGDVDGNSSPEMVIGAFDDEGNVTRVQVRDVANGTLTLNTGILSAAYAPQDLEVMDDVSGNAIQELVAAGLNPDTLAIRVQTRDGQTGALLLNIDIN